MGKPWGSTLEVFPSGARLEHVLLFGNDTKPEVARILIRGYRGMSHAEKAQQVIESFLPEVRTSLSS